MKAWEIPRAARGTTEDVEVDSKVVHEVIGALGAAHPQTRLHFLQVSLLLKLVVWPTKQESARGTGDKA